MKIMKRQCHDFGEQIFRIVLAMGILDLVFMKILRMFACNSIILSHLTYASRMGLILHQVLKKHITPTLICGLQIHMDKTLIAMNI